LLLVVVVAAAAAVAVEVLLLVLLFLSLYHRASSVRNKVLTLHPGLNKLGSEASGRCS
jgi:hypothetical protein